MAPSIAIQTDDYFEPLSSISEDESNRNPPSPKKTSKVRIKHYNIQHTEIEMTFEESIPMHIATIDRPPVVKKKSKKMISGRIVSNKLSRNDFLTKKSEPIQSESNY